MRLIQWLVRATTLSKHPTEHSVDGRGFVAANPDARNNPRLLAGFSVSINDEAGKGYVYDPVHLPKLGEKVCVDWGDVVGVNYLDTAAVREFNYRTVRHPNLSSSL
jgi:hypothetical protein